MSLPRLTIVASECIRCASCSSIAPEIFEVVRVSRIRRQPRDAAERATCEAAAINCPTGAIVWREDES